MGGTVRVFEPVVELNPVVEGLNVIDTQGVADVDVVLGGGEGAGEVIVSQLNTFDDFYVSMRQNRGLIPLLPNQGLFRSCHLDRCCRDKLRMHVLHYEGCRSFHRPMGYKGLWN